MINRPFRKTLRFYRNRLSSFFDSSDSAALDDQPRRRHRRRLKRRTAGRPPLVLVVLAAISLLLALYISVNRFIPPSWRIPPHSKSHLHPAPTTNLLHGTKSSLAPTTNHSVHLDNLTNSSHPLLYQQQQKQLQLLQPPNQLPNLVPVADHHVQQAQPLTIASPSAAVSPAAQFTRTCYHTLSSSNAVCVHTPLCLRHTTVAYLADTLKCASHTTASFLSARLTKTRCVALERRLETAADIYPVEQKSRVWLTDLEARSRLLWFPRDAILIRLPPRAASLPHFAARILALHHILANAGRYGLPSLTNIVLAAHPSIARKLRYSKSWHHGLLAAVIHPYTPVYSHAALEQAVAQQTERSTPGLLVFVSDGMWGLTKARRVPCFRRVALPAPAHPHFLLPEDDFPGVVSASALTSATRFRDAEIFRDNLFRSLGRPKPALSPALLYLHRTTTRSLTTTGHVLLQAKLAGLAAKAAFEFHVVDVTGMSFVQQVEAMGGASVVVGVHGTQMLNSLFLPVNASMVEIFPFAFANPMVEKALGPMIHYDAHQVVRGDHFAQLAQFSSIKDCFSRSSECRRWYQSDGRQLEFGELDAAAVGTMVENAIARARLMIPAGIATR